MGDLVKTITSTANPRVKDVVRLQRQSAERRRCAAFCLEHRREWDRALAAGLKPNAVFVTDPEDRVVVEGRDAEVFVVSESVLEKVAYRQNPDGFVAVFDAPACELGGLPKAADGVWVVCHGLEKPGNLGAIARTAEAAGVAGLLVDQPGFDLYNPNAVRASTGALFSLPMAAAEPEAVRDWLKARGVRLLAATPNASTAYTAADLTGSVAWVLGAEDRGLDAFWSAQADVTVSIPVAGAVDSLNVSAAAAILLFETVRQRG